MKKYVLMLVSAIAALFYSTPAAAYDCEVDGIYYYRTSATELEVACKVFSDNNRTAYSGAVTIPATVTYNGKTFNVTSIGEYAFRDCNSLTSVTIPSSIREIKSFAFYNCSSINAINIPATVAAIGAGCFEGCASIVSMTIPTGITEIEDELFFGCTALKTVVLPASITAIGENAFARCTSLLSVYLLATTAPTCANNAFDKVDRTWCTLYVPKGSKSYQNESVMRDFFIEEFEGKIEQANLTPQISK